jgi:hypothetical protein
VPERALERVAGLAEEQQATRHEGEQRIAGRGDEDRVAAAAVGVVTAAGGREREPRGGEVVGGGVAEVKGVARRLELRGIEAKPALGDNGGERGRVVELLGHEQLGGQRVGRERPLLGMLLEAEQDHALLALVGLGGGARGLGKHRPPQARWVGAQVGVQRDQRADAVAAVHVVVVVLAGAGCRHRAALIDRHAHGVVAPVGVAHGQAGLLGLDGVDRHAVVGGQLAAGLGLARAGAANLKVQVDRVGAQEVDHATLLPLGRSRLGATWCMMAILAQNRRSESRAARAGRARRG